MQIFFCILIFIMGTVFGSFFTLAVYRIPLNKNIVNERSFCPKCNHRLEFIDLIPVLSYIFLRGKCRYCGEKVRIRYLILEVLSGIVFLVSYLSLGVTYPFFEIYEIIYFVAFIMFYITVLLIAGIDKENFYIDKRVLLFGLIMQTLYQLYLYTFRYTFDITRQFLVLLVCTFLTLFIDTINLKKSGETKYIIQIAMFIIYLLMFIPINNWLIFSLLSIAILLIYYIYKKVKFNIVEKPDILQELPNTKIPVGFCLGISSIIVIIAGNFMLL